MTKSPAPASRRADDRLGHRHEISPRSSQKLVDADIDAWEVRQLMVAAGVGMEPLTAADAAVAGTLRAIAGGKQLSLGDRCCPALAVRSTPAVVTTADRVWVSLGLPVEVRLIR